MPQANSTKGPITTIYFRNPQQKTRVEDLAKRAGLSVSQYLIQSALGEAGGDRAVVAKVERETEEWKARALDAERRNIGLGDDLRDLTRQLLPLLKAANLAQAEGLGVAALRPLDPNVLRVLTTTRDAQGRRRHVPDSELLMKLGVDATDVDRIEFVNATLTSLLADGLVTRTERGYRWIAD